MSVQERPSGFLVRYRPPNGERGKDGKVKQQNAWFRFADYGSRELAKAAADAFDTQFELRKKAGRVGAIAAQNMRLDAYAQQWFRDFVLVELKRKTQIDYAEQWDRHLLKRVGHLTLGRCTTPLFEELRKKLVADGVGGETIAKLFGILQAMFREAVLWGYVEVNPVKPIQKRKRTSKTGAALVRAIQPLEVEAHRAFLLEQGRELDALIVCLLHYAGLRPEEVLGLDWSKVLKQTLVIDQALQLEELKPTKNERNRSVRLLAPLASDLHRYQMKLGHPGSGLVVERPQFERGGVRGKPGQTVQRRAPNWKPGQPWPDSHYRSWRRNTYQGVRETIGLARQVPYDGRHSFASLLLHEGHGLAYVAGQIGDTIQTCSETYVHVIEELLGQPGVSAEETIMAARGRVARQGVHQVCTELSNRKAV